MLGFRNRFNQSPVAPTPERPIAPDLLSTETVLAALAGHFTRPVSEMQGHLANQQFHDSLEAVLDVRVDGVVLVINGLDNLHIECEVWHEEGTSTSTLRVRVANASCDALDDNVVELPVEDPYFAHIVEQAA